MDEDVLPGYLGILRGKIEVRGNIQDILEYSTQKDILTVIYTNGTLLSKKMQKGCKILILP